MEGMDATMARRRVEEAPVARLATVGAEGRPHLVPCCFALAGQIAYSAVDDKPKSAGKLRRIRNIEAQPAVSLLVDHYEANWSALWWVRLDGSARLVDSPSEFERARVTLQTKYPQYGQVAIRGPIIAIDIGRWVAWP